MTRNIRGGFPIRKEPRGQNVDHSPDDRRKHHPARSPGMDEARRLEKHHDKK